MPHRDATLQSTYHGTGRISAIGWVSTIPMSIPELGYLTFALIFKERFVTTSSPSIQTTVERNLPSSLANIWIERDLRSIADEWSVDQG
jgi:hypothetical protein